MQRIGFITVTGLALSLLLLSTAPASSAPAKARVGSIVFIGKAKACPCTTKRIAAGWKALKKGLGKRRTPVKRIQSDVKPTEAARYKKKRAYKVLPAIYFLTSAGKVIELLQGIVTTADVQQVIKGR
jgi:hypothetical protein